MISRQELTVDDLIKVPHKLKILILSNAEIEISQMSSIMKCLGLIKLDLSGNKIDNLQNDGIFKNLSNLRILNLHQNVISNWDSLKVVTYCKKLSYLSIYQNPILSQSTIRHQIIQAIPQLKGIDFNAITDEERWNQLFYNSERFQIFSLQSKIQWPIVNYSGIDDPYSPKKSSQIGDQKQLIYMMWREIETISKIHSQSSAILTIQRQLRGHFSRKKTIVIKQKFLVKRAYLIGCVKQWKTYIANKQEILDILKDNYRPQILRIKQLVGNFRKKKREAILQAKASVIIVRFLKQIKSFFTGTLKELRVDEYQKIYIHQDDVETFQRFIQMMKLKFIIHKKTDLMRSAESFDDREIYKQFEFPRPYKFYESGIVTYRLPQHYNFIQFPQFNQPNIMLKAPSERSKVSLPIAPRKSILSKKDMDAQINERTENQDQYLNKYKMSNLLTKNRINYKLSEEEHQRYVNMIKVIDKFQLREYHQLLEIFIPNKMILLEIVKQVWRYNAEIYINKKQNEDKKLFFIYFEYSLRRSASALKIQRSYRSYAKVKKSGLTVTEIIKSLQKQKAIQVLQTWFRSIKYTHHNHFFKAIQYRLSQIKTNILFMPTNVYTSLESISLNNENRIKFIEQLHNIFYKDGSILLYYSHIALSHIFKDINQAFITKQIIPSWVIPNSKSIQYEVTQGDIMHIVNYKSLCKFHNINGRNWISFEFENVNEAKNRITCLAIHTYLFNGSCFIDLFDQSEVLSDDKQILNWMKKRISNIQKFFKLQQITQELLRYDQLIGKQEKQIFIILSQERIESFYFHLVKCHLYQNYLHMDEGANIKKPQKIQTEIYVSILNGLQNIQNDIKNQDTQIGFDSSIVQNDHQNQNPKIQYLSTETHQSRTISRGQKRHTNMTQETNFSRVFTKLNLDSNLNIQKKSFILKHKKQLELNNWKKSEKINFTQESTQTQNYQNQISLIPLVRNYQQVSYSEKPPLFITNPINQNIARQKYVQDYNQRPRQTSNHVISSQYENKQISVDMVKKFKIYKEIQKQEKNDEIKIILGSGVINRQGNIFSLKYPLKKLLYFLRKTRETEIKEIKLKVQAQKFERQMQKEAHQDRIQYRKQRNLDLSLEYRIEMEELKVFKKQKSFVIEHSQAKSPKIQIKQISNAHTYVHAVFPEEIYPLFNQNSNFDFNLQ